MAIGDIDDGPKRNIFAIVKIRRAHAYLQNNIVINNVDDLKSIR